MIKVAASEDGVKVYHHWHVDPQIFCRSGEMELPWRHVQSSLPEQPMWMDWVAEVARIHRWLYNCQLLQPVQRCPKCKELAVMCDQLDNFVISHLAEAKAYVKLTMQYQLARVAAFPEEKADLLQVQLNVPMWPSEKQSQPIKPPLLSAQAVVAFYSNLYTKPMPVDSQIPSLTSKLLVNRHKWPDTDDLAHPFLAEEVKSTCIKLNTMVAPGLTGISPTAFKGAPAEFHKFTAKVLNFLCENDCNTSSTSLGCLLFKQKHSNQEMEVAHYHPISVLDADRHLLHSILAACITPQIQQAIPQE